MIKMPGYEGGPTNDMRKGLVFIALSLPLTLAAFVILVVFATTSLLD